MAIRWMIYGATGYTGQLVAEEAIKRGHDPILAGRNREALAPIAKRLGLKYMVFDLNDVKTVAEAIGDLDVVYHAAGPFSKTSEPMVKACLATGTHYLDITGEYTVMESVFALHEAALANKIALICGVGFDIVPSDCLATYVAQKISAPHTIEIAIHPQGTISTGTLKSVMEMAPDGGHVRRNGELVSLPIGAGGKRIRFSYGEGYAIPVPFADIAAAYRSTRAPNITAYLRVPPGLATAARITGPLTQLALRSPAIKNTAFSFLERYFPGPTTDERENNNCYLWARAINREGTATADAWLETREAYSYTAEIGVRAVERVVEWHPVGALTPAQAFGPDFALDVPGTKRLDKLG
jgi:short subunit dehydrogenase-like uncharacterized protein